MGRKQLHEIVDRDGGVAAAVRADGFAVQLDGRFAVELLRDRRCQPRYQPRDDAGIPGGVVATSAWMLKNRYRLMP